MMVEVFLYFSYESVLDMHNLVGLIGNSALVGHYHYGDTLFLVELFQKLDYLHTGLGVECSCWFVG